MTPLAIHLNISFCDRRVIAPTVAQRRAVAVVLARLSRMFPILAFCCVDTHIHVLILGDQALALHVGGRIKDALVNLVDRPGPFNRTHCEPVFTQSHLERAFLYVLRQDRHHGALVDPLHDGSSLPDLLGLRLLAPATRALVRSHLPRVGRGALMEALGVTDLVPDDLLSPDLLADAAAATLGLADLGGRSAPACAARLAAVHACPAPAAVLADAIGLRPVSIRRLRASPADATHVLAVRLQLDLRRRLGANVDSARRLLAVS